MFTWDTAGSTPQLLSDGATDYVYGPAGVPVEQFNASGAGGLQYYFADAHGSTVGLTSSAGAVDATWAYSPWGQTTAHTGSASTPIGFAGAYTDIETGLLYLQARYYDPTTALFLSVDALISVARQAYLYTDDDPLNRTDPTGLWWGSFCLGGSLNSYLPFGGSLNISGCVGWTSGSGLILSSTVSTSAGYGLEEGGGLYAGIAGGSEDYASELSGTACTAGGDAQYGVGGS